MQFVLLVRAKFSVPENEAVSLVMEADGCLVETDDLPYIISLQQPLMILRGTEGWTQVCFIYCERNCGASIGKCRQTSRT